MAASFFFFRGCVIGPTFHFNVLDLNFGDVGFGELFYTGVFIFKLLHNIHASSTSALSLCSDLLPICHPKFVSWTHFLSVSILLCRFPQNVDLLPLQHFLCVYDLHPACTGRRVGLSQCEL